jgi:hypothetical protein
MKRIMKLKIHIVIAMFITLSLVTGLVGCGKTQSTTVETTSSAVVLTLVNGDQTKTFTMSELKALSPITGYAGRISSIGSITGPFQYKGISITELLKTIGGINENEGIRVSAKEGYSMSISYRQLNEGNFIVLDSSTGKEVTPSSIPTLFLAYEEDGNPISDDVGPLRLGIMTSNNTVTDGHWWVKWVQSIEVVAAAPTWTLVLEGAITENLHATEHNGLTTRTVFGMG